ncbi:hypothetical protein N1037_08555 [Phaeobacter sp. G2]|nr:hypothetical protein N1037_08555 [Phaeobacter sp. G2]
MGAPRVSEAAIQRAINAAKGTGIPIGAVIINNTAGTVRIEVQSPETVDAPLKAVQKSGPKKWNQGQAT